MSALVSSPQELDSTTTGTRTGSTTTTTSTTSTATTIVSTTALPGGPFEEDGIGSSRSSSSSSLTSVGSSSSLFQSSTQQQQQEQEHGRQGESDEMDEDLADLEEEEEQDDEENEDEDEVEELESSISIANDGFPHYGMVSYIGRRKEMEDAAAVVGDFMSLPCDIARHSAETNHQSSHHFYGVFDGHGGSQVALFCKDRLHVALTEEIQEMLSAAGSAEVTDTIWERAMESCFLKVHNEVGSMCLQPGGLCDRCEGNNGVCCDTVGSTAVVAVVTCCRIIVANAGDSRVVISRAGRAIPLSNDHKPERPDEMQRIEEAGGRVIFWNGHRVMGMLAMSRAIGDRYLRPYVIPNPDVRCLRRSEDDEFIVLASDGLWDVLSNDQVCDVTRMCLAGRCNSNIDALAGFMHGTENSQARRAAAYLTKLAYNRRSGDNISVVVVDLRNGQTGAAGLAGNLRTSRNGTSTSSQTPTSTPAGIEAATTSSSTTTPRASTNPTAATTTAVASSSLT